MDPHDVEHGLDAIRRSEPWKGDLGLSDFLPVVWIRREGSRSALETYRCRVENDVGIPVAVDVPHLPLDDRRSVQLAKQRTLGTALVVLGDPLPCIVDRYPDPAQ